MQGRADEWMLEFSKSQQEADLIWAGKEQAWLRLEDAELKLEAAETQNEEHVAQAKELLRNTQRLEEDVGSMRRRAEAAERALNQSRHASSEGSPPTELALDTTMRGATHGVTAAMLAEVHDDLVRTSRDRAQLVLISLDPGAGSDKGLRPADPDVGDPRLDGATLQERRSVSLPAATGISLTAGIALQSPRTASTTSQNSRRAASRVCRTHRNAAARMLQCALGPPSRSRVRRWRL
jgi:hypothetical protein